MSLFEKNRVAIWDMPFNGEPQTSPENRGKECACAQERGCSEGLL